jgi:hypothetical protein
LENSPNLKIENIICSWEEKTSNNNCPVRIRRSNLKVTRKFAKTPRGLLDRGVNIFTTRLFATTAKQLNVLYFCIFIIDDKTTQIFIVFIINHKNTINIMYLVRLLWPVVANKRFVKIFTPPCYVAHEEFSRTCA